MSAHVVQREEWAWYCPDCAVGGDWVEVEFSADDGMHEHNDDNHDEATS